MSTAATRSITSQIHNLTLSNPNPRFIKLPDITCDELVDLDKPSDPAENNLPTSTDAEMADLGRCGYDLPTYNKPPFCYGEYAQHDDNRYSTAARIDNVTIPPHLVNLIKRDTFDMGEREGRVTGVNWDGNDHFLFRGKYHELTDYYNIQDAGRGKVEVVLYQRKRKADDMDVQSTNEKSKVDSRGRIIERTVWASQTSKASRSQQLRPRSPTPAREPVFRRASDNQPSSTKYQTLSPPTPSTSPEEYHRKMLFHYRHRAFRDPKVATRTRRQALGVTKAARAAEQDLLRTQRGGLVIDLTHRMRCTHSHDEFNKADAIAHEYANAFEDWDEEMREALQRYVGDEDRRIWFRTMWQAPEGAENEDSASVYSQGELEEGEGDEEGGGEGWADDVWQGQQL
jgi:hypothetical protein